MKPKDRLYATYIVSAIISIACFFALLIIALIFRETPWFIAAGVFLAIFILNFFLIIKFAQSDEYKKIIELSIKETLNQVEEKKPDIVYHTYYGAYQHAPYYLVIWYFFSTDEDWNIAKSNGFTKEIENITISNMKRNGYPASAFEENYIPFGNNHKFINDSNMNEKEFEETVNKYKEMATYRKVLVSFASQEDVKNKADGNYYYYFKQ